MIRRPPRSPPFPYTTLSRSGEPYDPYTAEQLAKGERLHNIPRHMLGLFTGRSGARAYRRHLATEAVKPGANLQTLRDAVAHVVRETAALEARLAAAE